MASPVVAGYYEGLNQKLLAAIPPDARRVLEFGCANGRLGAAAKQLNPRLHWTGVDVNADAVAEAARRVDAVVWMDLDAPDPSRLEGGYDLVLFGDVLEHLRDPMAFLRLAHAVGTPSARLLCCLPNMAHISVIERMLAGDLSYDSAGLLDATHLRFLSPASAFKLLLDAGWLPNLHDSYSAGHPNKRFVQHIVAAAQQLGIPPNTAARNILEYQLIVDCVKAPGTAGGEPFAPFSVVVPVNNVAQFELNVRRSPGLAEVGAEIFPIQGARNAAEALVAGRGRAATPWVVFCHQDVYFPCGTGRALAALFGAIPAPLAAGTLVGFAGLGRDAHGAASPAGLVIDRIARFDHPAAADAASIDEFAIAVSRDTRHEIDPRLGWHLWATDLCLAAGARSDGASARIARVPLFHNSYNDGVVPAAFHSSAQLLATKYPGTGTIGTLCGPVPAPA